MKRLVVHSRNQIFQGLPIVILERQMWITIVLEIYSSDAENFNYNSQQMKGLVRGKYPR